MNRNSPVDVDIPELVETFADHIGVATFDGHQLRANFYVTRANDGPTQSDLSLWRYPVCRLVLTPPAMMQLYNQLAHMVSVMEQSGLVRRSSDASMDTDTAASAKDPEK